MSFCGVNRRNIVLQNRPFIGRFFCGCGVGVRFAHRQPTLIWVCVAWALPTGFWVVDAVGRGRFGFGFLWAVF